MAHVLALVLDRFREVDGLFLLFCMVKSTLALYVIYFRVIRDSLQ